MRTKTKIDHKTPSQYLKLGKPGRDQLRSLVKFINTDKTGDGKKLWDILSALRGPDMELEEFTLRRIKYATTAVIRHKIGLKGKVSSYDGSGTYGFDVNPDNSDNLAQRKSMDDRGHFREHIRYAFHALGLDYYGDN